jgi:hypothetical protein
MTSNIPKILTFNDIEYVSCETIRKDAPIWWGKTVRTTRQFVTNKKISNEDHIFARRITDEEKNTDDDEIIIDDTNEWKITNGKRLNKDIVFIKKNYLMSCDDYTNEINGGKVVNEDGIEKAPNIVELLDDEKFHDDDGNVLEIETRGERKWDKILFKVKDVANVFKMPNLYITIIDKNSKYVMEKHYKYCACNILHNMEKKQALKQQQKKNYF